MKILVGISNIEYAYKSVEIIDRDLYFVYFFQLTFTIHSPLADFSILSDCEYFY